MVLSSPGGLACSELLDIDQVEDEECASCRDYAKDIFTYLMEAEVSNLHLSSLLFPFTPRPLSAGSFPAKGLLHEQAARHHSQHALSPCGLAGGGH